MDEEFKNIEDLAQAMHDTLCGCGGKCHGYLADYNRIITFFEEQWCGVYPLENYLGQLKGSDRAGK